MLRLEEICDHDLHMWHCMFWIPGMLNDLNILDLIPHFSNVFADAFPPIAVTFKIKEV